MLPNGRRAGQLNSEEQNMMRAETTEGRIREFIVKQFPIARKNGLKSDEKWLETGMIDSLGILDLVHFLEEEFSLVISDDELQPDNFGSLDEVVEFVQKKCKSPQ
jgi:acyl carrier protein